MAKAGPKTESGKAAVRQNAVKHGLTSPAPVIVGLESESDWKAHLSGILSSLEPVGHLETVLVEDIANLLWRRRRVLRHETECISLGQEQIDEDLAENQLKIAEHLGDLERRSKFGMTLGRESAISGKLLAQSPDDDTLRDRMRRERLLPSRLDLDLVTRYEAHLSRRFERTLHELEAMQVRRQGQQAPLARLDIQGMPEN